MKYMYYYAFFKDKATRYYGEVKKIVKFFLAMFKLDILENFSQVLVNNKQKIR